MQDLTTGSLTRHLLKTTSFMLVSMVFQTLYFLVDLYWVGRLGTEAVAAVGVCRQPDVHRPGRHADAGRRDDDAGVACRGPQRSAARATRLQPVAGAVAGVGVLFLVVAMAVRDLRRALPPTPPPPAGRRLSAWFIPAMALQFGLVAMGAALRGTGNFKPGMVVQTGTVSSTSCWRRC